jgi:transcriptional regulator GlxA family with amidase domain
MPDLNGKIVIAVNPAAHGQGDPQSFPPEITMADQIPLRKRPLAERIERAEQLARQNLAEAFGVQEFAEAAGLSRSRFSVAYQNHRGVSAGAFLRCLRMDRAVELLKETNEPVAHIGSLVGYPEPTGFGRAFRRHTGLSPSRFRSTVRKALTQDFKSPVDESGPSKEEPSHSMIRATKTALPPVELVDLPPLPSIAAS